MTNSKQFVAKYAGDQLIVLRHTLTVMESQLEDNDLRELPSARALVEEMSATLRSHAGKFEKMLEAEYSEHRGQISEKASEILTEITGMATGLYNKIRTEKVSKMLRDDYTALCLAVLAYSMLLTTSRSLGEDVCADLCAELIGDLPPFVMQLNDQIPAVVVSELRSQELVITTDASDEAVEVSKKAWRA